MCGPPGMPCPSAAPRASQADMPRPALGCAGCVLSPAWIALLSFCVGGQGGPDAHSHSARWLTNSAPVGRAEGACSQVLCLVARPLRAQRPTCSAGGGASAGSWFLSNSRQDGGANSAPARDADDKPRPACLEAVASREKCHSPHATQAPLRGAESGEHQPGVPVGSGGNSPELQVACSVSG